MFKGLSDLGSLMKKAQEMQGHMQQLQEKLRGLKCEGTAGAGMVTVTVNGEQQLLACQIEPSLIESGDREMIEDLVVAAVNQALEKSKTLAGEEMSQLAGGFDLSAIQKTLGSLGLSK